MPRVLVTGGAGFLGSTVAKKLATLCSLVVVADVREPATLAPGTVFQKCDVTDPEMVAEIINAHKIDTIVHLAAIMTPGRDIEFERRVDVGGAENVFRAAAQAGVKKIVVSSSGAAYGYHPDSPEWITEKEPVRGNEEYSYSKHKRLVEELLAELAISHPQMQQTIFRIGTILGPTVDNQITALWGGKRILKIRGNDSPFVFIWVDDVAEIFVRAVTENRPGIYNVAGDGKLSVQKIAKRLNKKLFVVPATVLKIALFFASRLKLSEHGPEKVRFLQYRPVLDNTKLKTVFGYSPQKTSSAAFDAYIETHPSVVAN